jgi:hypothetical protein
VKPEAGMTATSTPGFKLGVGDWLAYQGKLIQIKELIWTHRGLHGRETKIRLSKPIDGIDTATIRHDNLYWRVDR